MHIQTLFGTSARYVFVKIGCKCLECSPDIPKSKDLEILQASVVILHIIQTLTEVDTVIWRFGHFSVQHMDFSGVHTFFGILGILRKTSFLYCQAQALGTILVLLFLW